MKQKLIHIFLNYFFLTGVILPFSFSIQAQELIPLETEFFNNQTYLSVQQNKLDSLNKELIKSASKIDQEKSKVSPDESKLGSMMAAALTLSKKIETQQKLVTVTEEKNETIRRQLDKFYFHVLDSLQKRESAEKSSEVKKNIIRQIGLISEKRLLISPPIPSLSFNPKELIKMSVQSDASSIEKDLFRDYLVNAIKEITEHLEYLQEKREEIEDIAKLQEKASRFMKEVQSDDKLSIFGQLKTFSAYKGTQSSYNINIITESTARSSFNILLRQLDITPKSNLNYSDYTDYNIRNKEFIQLIKEAEEKLTQYKQILNEKLVAENAGK